MIGGCREKGLREQRHRMIDGAADRGAAAGTAARRALRRRAAKAAARLLVADQRPTHDLDLHHRSGPLHHGDRDRPGSPERTLPARVHAGTPPRNRASAARSGPDRRCRTINREPSCRSTAVCARRRVAMESAASRASRGRQGARSGWRLEHFPEKPPRTCSGRRPVFRGKCERPNRATAWRRMPALLAANVSVHPRLLPRKVSRRYEVSGA